MSTPEPNVSEPSAVPQVVEHLFRHEGGKILASLTRVFGLDHLSLAEDVVQEALARALQTWPFYGVPQNPAAWITRTARNLALDVVRREKCFRDKEASIALLFEQQSPAPEVPLNNEIPDDRLRLMFVCCHPVIPREAQVALALKTLCGFSPAEIGRAFLTSEAAIAKRLTRAKQKIREAGVPFEIPAGQELLGRLEAVLQALYLLFNEGYKASYGERLVREEVCREAIRLGTLLSQHPSGNQPATHALLALMLLSAARFPARLDPHGRLLRLEEQDRNLWDQRAIARGMFHLAQSAAGSEITRFHIEAAIAACHCRAPNYASTDWPQILGLYDELIKVDDGPVIALNRAVAVANVHGAEAGIAALEGIAGASHLADYYLFPAVLGELELRRGNGQAAREHFLAARALAPVQSEHAFLDTRVQACTPGLTATV